MKKLILISLVFLSFTVGGNHTHKDWEIVEEGAWGSFWWKVERLDNPQGNGDYYYYVYFQSNSYLNEKDAYGQYVKAISYIEGITITLWQGEIPTSVHLKYVLADWNKTQVAYFISGTPDAYFGMRYHSVTPYGASTY